MAAALLRLHQKNDVQIDSAGVYEGGLDPFVEIVMKELGVDLHDHEPKSIDEIDLNQFNRIIALTPEAAAALRERCPDACIEYWDVENPSDERGGRSAVVEAYTRVRDEISKRLRDRFPEIYENS